MSSSDDRPPPDASPVSPTGSPTGDTGSCPPAVTARGGPGDLPDLAAAILDVVDLVPPGRVATYGDVAEYLGRGGPRTVGSVMARWGGGVPWWRIVRADGTPAPCHTGRALERLRAEGTPLRPDGRRVDLGRARWDGTIAGSAARDG